MEHGCRLLADFSDIGEADAARVGWKGAKLGELIRHVGPLGVQVPPGFVLTTDAFDAFVKHNALGPVIAHAIASMGRDGVGAAQASGIIRSAFSRSAVPPALVEPVLTAYRRLWTLGGECVAVRLSAPEPGFCACQGGACLNVVGEAALLDAIRTGFGSRFDEDSLRLWAAHGADPLSARLALCVQRMVRSDLGCAGAMSWSPSRTAEAYDVTVTSAWGLGGRADRGCLDDDVHRLRVPRDVKAGEATLVKTCPGSKLFKIVYDAEAGDQRCVPTTPEERAAETLTPAELTRLARWGALIAQACPRIAEVVWAKDGRSGEMFVLEARDHCAATSAAPKKRTAARTA